MAIELVPLCTGKTTVAPPLSIGAGAMGNRSVGEITSVELTGERLTGSLAGNAAADWMIVSGAIGNIDVRMAVRTPDGALIYVTYSGKLDLASSDGGLKAFVVPTFETGDERYAWLNGIQAVGKGLLSVGADGATTIAYEFYELR